MKNFFYAIVFLSTIVCLSCSPQQDNSENTSLLSDQELSSIGLLGGTLISSMEEHAFFETALTTYFDDKYLSLRNIAWPADDVFGLARSQFGSAQNTRSWQPPSAEEGFGSDVLQQHIKAIDPTLLFIGYGAEVAFVNDESEFELFQSGYERLLDYIDSLGVNAVLLSPIKQEKTHLNSEHVAERNEWLNKATQFIAAQARDNSWRYIDLFEQVITNPDTQLYTQNGIQLNELGYQKMSEVLINALIPEYNNQYTLSLDSLVHISDSEQCDFTNLKKTLYGTSFNLTAEQLGLIGKVKSNEPIAIYVDGELVSNSQDTLSTILLPKDRNTYDRLRSTIIEKNRLYRYKLRPLNEAYIYLFRRHEMGHLAYEMNDLEQLVQEKEKEIKNLVSTSQHFVEIEMIKPWSAPKDYAYDEVPLNIPVPDIDKELAAFKVAPGMDVNLFAADPMIANPININWDNEGRAWVATSSIYPHIVPGREPNDRIVILEDTDKDGKADKHTIFADNLLVPHSVMPVKGGAYVTATTQLLFLADTDGDDIADETRVVFDGFGNADIHHTIHGLRWTPWGDLHFTQSIYINSFVETPSGSKVLNGSGTWSFRPETESLEIFSRGLVNPWGEAFDEWGQAFATDGAGSSGISHIFPESAHQTAVGANKIIYGLNRNTPKNTAAEVVYSRQLPSDWQGNVITSDFRANRTVRYKLSPSMSSYNSEEVQTILSSDHRSYRPVDSKIGPDGGLYIVDWYNPIIDHGEVDFHHPVRDKVHGRVWRMINKSRQALPVIDFSKLSNAELLKLLKSPEQHVRLQANRTLVMNECDPVIVKQWINGLSKNRSYEKNRLEGLWLLTALNHYDENLLVSMLQSRDYRVRGASLRMLMHWSKQSNHIPLLKKLINDRHPQVRLEALHCLREMGGLTAAELAVQSLDHPQDQNLEFATWLTLRQLKDDWIPELENENQLFGGSVKKQMYALNSTDDKRIAPLISQLLAHGDQDPILAEQGWTKLASIGDADVLNDVLIHAIETSDLSLLNALHRAPKSNTSKPTNLSQISKLLQHDSIEFKTSGIHLCARWEADQYLDQIIETANTTDDKTLRQASMEALAAMDQWSVIKTMAKDLDNKSIATAACISWIKESPGDAASTSVELLSRLDSIDYASDIFSAFRSVDAGPDNLLNALKGIKLPEAIASAGIRMVQTSGLNLFDLEKALRDSGDIHAIGAQLTKEEKELLIADAMNDGNFYHGRQIYRSKRVLCGSCHVVNNEGGLSGPDLTTVGSYMTPNSLLESILNPNADIKQGYETVILNKKDGGVISGLLHRKTSDATLIRLANSEVMSIPNEEIEKIDVSEVSLMPAGLTASLHRDELKDLLHYLINLGAEN